MLFLFNHFSSRLALVRITQTDAGPIALSNRVAFPYFLGPEIFYAFFTETRPARAGCAL